MGRHNKELFFLFFCVSVITRLAVDMLLWQPANPAVVEKANAQSMFISCMDVIQPAATREERFQFCKTGLTKGTHIRTCIRTYVHTYLYVYVHTYMYIHTNLT